MQNLNDLIVKCVKSEFDVSVTPELTRPDEQFGDFSTNVALKLASQVGKPPRDVATKIVELMDAENSDIIDLITIAGPGFINITLKDSALYEQAINAPGANADLYKNKVVVAEYGDPNPFKVLHAGHLYTAIMGDAIANLVERAGGQVHRVNYGGDVGLHVGKTMWAIIKKLDGENPDLLDDVAVEKRSNWLSERYVEGNAAYEENQQVQADIKDMNKRVYELHRNNDQESKFARIYWTCRKWSYDYFNYFYKRVGIEFEKFYPESEVEQEGVLEVEKQLKNGVYQKSDGAVVFKGDEFGLHTRVFINSQGIPTYEAKEVGLILKKHKDYKFDKSIVITGNEQTEYMKVVLKSIEQFKPGLVRDTSHLTHGLVKLAGGVKMSSRKGNVLRGEDILNAAKAASRTDGFGVTLAAVKYAFLKVRMGGDIIYDPNDSISLEGNSGPYLQYAHARARSILQKLNGQEKIFNFEGLEPDERSLARKLSLYPEVVQTAAHELMPHNICTYLYELSQSFNRFYEKNRVVGDDRQGLRANLVLAYADILKDGLKLLNIPTPERV